MSAIRPDLPSSLPVAGPAVPSAQARAAQAAFFRAALGQVQAAAPQNPAPTPTQAQPTPQAASAGAEDSPRLPRLGQFLDIRV